MINTPRALWWANEDQLAARIQRQKDNSEKFEDILIVSRTTPNDEAILSLTGLVNRGQHVRRS